jgi:DNA-binding transcriptional LysR family regulator
LVERGLGVALLPRLAVIRDVAESRRYLIQLETETPVLRPIVAATRLRSPPSSTSPHRAPVSQGESLIVRM